MSRSAAAGRLRPDRAIWPEAPARIEWAEGGADQARGGPSQVPSLSLFPRRSIASQEEPAVVTSAVRIFADIEQRERSRLLGDAPPGVVDRTPVLIFLEPQWESAEAREAVAVVAGEGALRLAGDNCKCRATKILARGRRRQFCEARVPLCALRRRRLLGACSYAFSCSVNCHSLPPVPLVRQYRSVPPGGSINWPRRTKPAAVRSPMRLLGGQRVLPDGDGLDLRPGHP